MGDTPGIGDDRKVTRSGAQVAEAKPVRVKRARKVSVEERDLIGAK